MKGDLGISLDANEEQAVILKATLMGEESGALANRWFNSAKDAWKKIR